MIPSGREIVREGLLMVGAAVVAAFIVGQVPQLKQWIRQQWRTPDQP